jgi:RHS repeat-associated protein
MKHLCFAVLTASGLFISVIQTKAQTFTQENSNLSGPMVSGTIAWADFDLDGDMDPLICGFPSTTTRPDTTKALLYRNKGNNQFELVANTGFTGVYMGSAAWADMNNDGWPDLALCGTTEISTGTMTSSSVVTRVYKNNGNGTFTSVGTFTGFTQGSVAWGDYNNDGFKDLLVTGSLRAGNNPGQTSLYKNNKNNTFSAVNVSLPGLSEGEGRWGDYDNDGRLDILLTGGNYVNYVLTPGTYLYHNDGNDQFSDAGAGLIALKNSSADFGDYDNDGRLDIVMIGTDANGASYTKVYHNGADGTFTDVSSNLEAASNGVVRWGDFNQDGNADIVIAGTEKGHGSVYNYVGNDQFRAGSFGFFPNYGADLNVSDINNDGNLDFSVVGSNGATYYINSSSTTNTAPAAPSGIQAHPSTGKVLLTWAPPADDHTASNGLGYNLVIGTTGSNCNIMSPEANLTSGKRYITGPGNAGNQNWQWLDLPNGAYYWKVQACDASYAGSVYSTQGSFTIPGSSLVVHINAADEINICNGGSTVLNAEAYPAASVYQWYKNGTAITGATSSSYTVTTSGQYYVEARTTGSFVQSVNTITVNTSATVTPPTASNGSGCYGSPIILTAYCGDNSSYCKWYTEDGRYIGNGSSLTVTTGQTTSYKVVSYNSTTQCSSAPATVTAYVLPAPPTPTGAAQQSTCGAGDTLTLVVNQPQSPYQIYWYSTATGGNPVASGNTLMLYDITGSVTYYAATYDPTHGCGSATRLAVTGTVATPPAPPVTQSYFPCTSGNVTLTATPTPSSLTCKWYNAETGGTMFHTGTSYTTTVTDPVVYFVSTYDSSTGCESTTRSPVASAVRGITDAPVAQGAVGYGSCSVTLYAATPPNATTCRWFADASQHTLLHTGHSYLTPVLPQNTVHQYWVAGYNEDNQCTGSAMTQVSATTLSIPTVLVNPDQIYPVPNNVLDEEYDDVNLFTGDVNLTVPLATLSGAKLSYTLNAFYTSRSAAITPYYTSNTLGGLGWKMLDYPKIAFDQVKNRYFFLDGLAAYPLDTLMNNNGNITFTAPGKYATMGFTLNNTNAAINQRTWTIINGKEEEYQFTEAPFGLPNNGYLWSLTRLVDAARTDTLAFSYNTQAQLTSITNGYDERLSFAFSNNRLTSIIHYINNSNSSTIQKEKIEFVYESAFPPYTSHGILSVIETYRNINFSDYTNVWWYQDAPPTLFEYYPSGAVNPGALKTITSPGGAKRTYAYLPVTVNNQTFRLVTGVATDAGHLVNYEGDDIDVVEPVEIRYEGATVSADGIYFQSNLCTVIPGKNAQTPLYTDANTSFEKGSHDDIFTNLDKDDLKKDYPLTGTHSLKFDGALNLRATSKRFSLNRDLRRVSSFESSLSNPVSETGSLDSLTLSFYCLQTHQTLDVDFYLDFNFYDRHKNRIDDWGCHDENYELQNEQYGQWVPFELRFGVPSNAMYFDFELRGGSKLYGYDFYMDEVTITGTESNVQGQLQYFFFNGNTSSQLRHLPDAYLQGTEAGMLKKLYYTGFETGQNSASWLDINDGPADVEFNTAQRHTSYNGTYALRVGDYKGNRASMKGTSIPIAAGTDHVMLSFHYSQPQFPGMQVRFTWGCNNTSVQSQDLTLDGSYFIDPGYVYFQKVVPVNGAISFSFSIEVRDAGEKSDVNDFFIDDLTVQMLHGAGNLQPINVQSPLLTGSSYLSRTFSDQFTELEVMSAVLVPAAMNNGTGYVQMKTLNGTTSAAAHSGVETAYNGEGMPTASTWHWARTNPDSTVTDVWSRTHFVYAKDIWSALHNNYKDQIALQWTEVSEDYFQTWNTSSGVVTQWNAFSTGGKTVWNPWRQFEMTGPVTPAQINAVVAGIAAPTYTPPAAQWIQIMRADSVSLQGDIIASVLNDSVPYFTQYSKRYLSSNQKRIPVQVAAFLNGSPGTCKYYGFEEYEELPDRLGASTTNSYAFTGKQSVTGRSITFQVPYNPAGADATSYVVGAFIMPQNNSFSIAISASGGFYSSSLFTVPDSLKNVWRYYEYIFTPPAAATTLQFSIQSSSNGLCLDDFRFSPVTAVMSATVYDISTYRKVAEIGNNADQMRLLSDRWGELHGVSGPGEVPLRFSSYYYSRNGTGNYGNYNPNDPNCGSMLTIAGGGTFFGMNDAKRSSIWSFSSSTGSRFDNLSGFTIPQNSHAALATSQLPANRSDWGISFRLGAAISYPLTPLFGLDLGGAGLAFTVSDTTLSVKIKSNTTNWVAAENLTLPQTFSSGLAIDVDLVFQNGLMHIWVNGEIISNTHAYTTSQFTKLQFFCNSSSYMTALTVGNICLFTDATLAAKFTDGLENSLQQQIMTGAGVVISETVYDRLNRPILQTQSVAFAGTGLGYRPTFITGMNWETGYMNGDVNNGKAYIEGGGNQDKGYLYWRSIYLKSPEDKVSYQFNPGYDFALRSQTNWEKAKKWLYTHTGEIIEYGGYVLEAAGYVLDVVDCILEPETAPLIIAVDAAELIATVAQIVDEYGSSASEKRQNSPITNYFYDREQNLAAVYLPNANKPDDPDENQIVEYEYDFRNHLKNENEPESGRVDYRWSNRDLLRFFATGNDRDSNRVRYIKYDRKERIIEQGFLTGNMTTDSAALAQAANDPGYPGAGVPHSVLYTYVWDGATTGAYGNYLTRDRLTGCNAWLGGHITSAVTYAYDVYGRTTTRTQNGNALTYSYDHIGNVKSLQYPPFSGFNFKVNYTYNKLGQIDSVFTSEETAALATMNYYPDGTASITQLNCKQGKGSIPIRYYYNAPRWLTSLTAGENGSHDGPDDDYTTDYFGLDLNYNVLEDWWSDLMDQVYYNGNLVSTVLTPGSKATHLSTYKQAYQYDETGRLNSYFSSEICNLLPFSPCSTMTYTFDLNGNLKEEQAWSDLTSLKDGWSFKRHYDKTKNRVEHIDYYYSYEASGNPDDNRYRRDTFYLQYDHSGNVIRQDYYHHNKYGKGESHGSLNKVYTRVVTYNENNQVSSVKNSHTGGTDTLIQYTYTAEGYRDTRNLIIGGGLRASTTWYRGLNGELLLEVQNQNGVISANYYVYADESPFAMFTRSGAQTISWLVLTDQYGSATELVNRSTKDVDASFVYDAYGALVVNRSHISKDYSLLFNGQEYDKDAKLYHFQARSYDPLFKTFLQPDPGKQNLALPYAYTDFDPVNYIDPDGAVRLWANDRKNGTNALKDKIAALRAANPNPRYRHGDLINFIQTSSLRSYDDKARFIIMMESRSPAIQADLHDLYKQGSKRKKGQPAGQYRDEWMKLKKWLREGKRHEMAPVSRIHKTVKLGIPMQRFQQFTFLTTQTFFEQKVGGVWSGNPIAHGAVGSPAAHKELARLLSMKVSPNIIAYQDNLALWMAGEFPGQQFRMHPNSYNNTLLKTTRAVVKAGTTLALRFF